MCVTFFLELLFDAEPQQPVLNRYYLRRGEYLGDGVYLQLNMRDEFVYNDKGRVLRIEGEPSDGATRKFLSADIKRWGDPRSGEPISGDEREVILKKLASSTHWRFVDQSDRVAGPPAGGGAGGEHK